ncbi:putative cyclic nucleotide-binding domain, rmlC-like jelly roll, RGS domain, RGS domain superfamily [Plasmopara halstedii]
MGCVCGTQNTRFLEITRICDVSLFLKLMGVDTFAQSMTMHKAAEAPNHRATIPAQAGQIAIIYNGLSSLFDVNEKNILNIRAYMPLGHTQAVVPLSPSHAYTHDPHISKGGTLLTPEIFLFWKSDKEIICRYVTEGAGDEVVLESTLCARVELQSQSRYLLLPSNGTDSGKPSSLSALTNGDLVGLLTTIPFFADLPTDKLAILTEVSTIRIYPSGCIIFREDEGISTQMFVTLAGSVEVTSSRATGPLATLVAGSFFGEMSLLINIPRAATVKALESCMLMSIEKKAFHSVLDQCPDARLSINKLLKERLLLKAILSGVLPFFSAIPNERMIRFSQEFEIEDHVRKNDIVLSQQGENGSQDSKFVFVVYGAVEISSKDRKPGMFGHDRSIFLTPGCYLGPFTFERMNLRNGKAYARSASVLLTCSFPTIVKLLEEYPSARAAANIAWFGERCDVASVLRHGTLALRFRTFLESEHSEENYLFFLDIEKFRQIEDKSERREVSIYIFERYIQPGAPKEVNLPAVIRDDIMDQMGKLSALDTVEPTFYNEACDEIMRLMGKDSFLRFKKSFHFQNIVEALDPHTNRQGSRLVAACHQFRDSLQVLRPGHVDMKNTQLERMLSTIQKSQALKNNVSDSASP